MELAMWYGSETRKKATAEL